MSGKPQTQEDESMIKIHINDRGGEAAVPLTFDDVSEQIRAADLNDVCRGDLLVMIYRSVADVRLGREFIGDSYPGWVDDSFRASAGRARIKAIKSLAKLYGLAGIYGIAEDNDGVISSPALNEALARLSGSVLMIDWETNTLRWRAYQRIRLPLLSSYRSYLKTTNRKIEMSILPRAVSNYRLEY